MKQAKFLFSVIVVLLAASGIVKAQDEKLKLSGELLTDERFLLKDKNDWAWNENRLNLKFEKKLKGKAKFYSEVWLRNIGVPSLTSSGQLYNKDIVSPYNIDFREAYAELYGFLFKNLDVKIGRQRIAWGTAYKLNPTDNLNPYDLEDIFDFGRHNGSEAINITYYLNNDYSLQAVYEPFFKPANMPIGIFSSALNGGMILPQGLTLKGMSDTLLMPCYNLAESSIAAFKLKGVISRFDFSLSYIWGRDGLPMPVYNALIPVDTVGGINIESKLAFPRNHIFGADLAGSILGIGVWAEAAVFLPEKNVTMTTDLSALYPLSPVPVTLDSTILDKSKPYMKFNVGGDYNFKDGSYLNIQYLHGFIQERGNDNLNDYFFLRYEKKFFNDRLKVAPIGGAFIVTDWNKIKDNYAVAYIPQVSYNATDDVEITLSAAIIDGKGDNLFANLKDYNMFMFKLKYSF